MNEMRALIQDTADKIFRDLSTKEDVDAAEKEGWSAPLWDALAGSGLTLAGIAEEHGGSGGEVGDALAVVRLAGKRAAPLPLAETFVAAWALSQSGVTVPDGPLTVAPPNASALTVDRASNSGPVLRGEARRVPWGSRVTRVVGIVDDGGKNRLALIDPADAEVAPDKNLAGEPRDALRFDGAPLTDDCLADLGEGASADSILALGALCRSAQMAGALETVLALSVEHANVRIQFGRPIGRFQAIRQQMAAMAAQAAAAGRAADVAATAFERGGGELEIAAAKARVGEAAGIASAIAHQVHGAMGITHEHALHQYTRRLWSWRDEFGTETFWRRDLGRRLAESGEGPWSFITQTGASSMGLAPASTV